MPGKIDSSTPDTTQFEKELIDEGKVVEGYMLRYLRQIRDLLLTLQASDGYTTEISHNISLKERENTQ